MTDAIRCKPIKRAAGRKFCWLSFPGSKQRSQYEEVVQLFVRFGGEPVAGVAVDTVLFDQGGGVGPPALPIESIGGFFGEGAVEDLGVG